nr:hypothetical protein [Tanacetum cinerariifolium]
MECYTGLSDKLSSSDADFAKSKAKGKERKKNIKSRTKSVDKLNAEATRLSIALNQATILKAQKDEEILRSLHPSSQEFAEVLKKTSHFVPDAQDRLAKASSLVAQTEYAFMNKSVDHAMDPLSPNEDWVNTMVDGPDNDMTGVVGNGNPRGVFMQGASHVMDDDAGLTSVGSERVSSGPNDVVVALFVR